MNVVPFHVEHLWEIDLPDDHPWRRIRDIGYARCLTDGLSLTVRDEARILFCGGVAKLDRDVGICWTFMARDSARHMLAFHRIAQRAIALCGFQRVLANTEACFSAGRRWLELLGFEVLEPIEGFDGREEILYVRTN